MKQFISSTVAMKRTLCTLLLIAGAAAGSSAYQTNKSVTIPGDAWTVYDIPPGGAELRLNINSASSNVVIKNSGIRLEDTSDAVQWWRSSDGNSSHVYRIDPVFSSREWLWVTGAYYRAAGGGGGGSGQLPKFNARVAAPDVDIDGLTEEDEENRGVWIGKGGARREVTVRAVQQRKASTQQTLTWSSGRLSLWTAATGGSILPGGSKTLPADEAYTCYAQCDNASASIRDCDIKTAYTVSGEGTAYDRIKLTLVETEVAPFTTVPVGATNEVSVTISPNPPGTNITLQIALLSGSGSAVFMPSGGAATNITNSTTVKIKGVTASSAESNIVLRAMLGSDVMASNRFTVVGSEIIEMGFTGDHMTRRWTNQTDIDSPDGSAPVWKKTNSPDDPVCYTMNASPAMFALFTNLPTISDSIAGVKVRTRVGTNVIGSASGVTISGGSTAVSGIGGGVPIPGSGGVLTMTPTFTWELSYDGGVSWCSAGSSGPHRMHFVIGTPNESPLYDLALDKACGYANGATQSVSGAAGIRSGIYGEIGSRYSGTGSWYSGTSVLDLYDTSDLLICGTYANLTAFLCRSVGMTASTVWVWSGTATLGYEWVYTIGSYLSTILVDPGSHAWTWHAVASTPEGYSDSALGVEGVNIVHRHPEAMDQYENAGSTMTTGPSYTYGAPYYYEWP